MRAISKALDGKDLSEIVAQCIEKGKGMFPKPLANIHDAADQLSDFLYGIQQGMRKVRKNSEDPIKYLTTQGIYSLRNRRFRALKKKLVFYCECGTKLKGINAKPCHGTMQTRNIVPREMGVDYDEWSITEDSSGLQGHPYKAIRLHEEMEE